MQRIISLISSYTRLYFSGLLFRMRPTEQVVDSLTLADLQKLARFDGSLPYHDKRVRALLWEVKYYAAGKSVAVAGEYLSELLLAEASDCVGTPFLMPMPMHPKRRRERGHNQTEVLCEAALKTIFSEGFLYAPNILRRTRHTKPQQGLERHDRLMNLKNSMEVSDPAAVKDRVCIVVDDVSTTGASFAEAKRALRAAGAREVRTVALAQS